MSLQEAMRAVQQGMAFSTAAGPRRPQQPSFEAGEPTPTANGPTPPRGGEDPFGSGDGGTQGEGTWSQPFKGQDGKFYVHNSTTDEYREAPPMFQPPEPAGFPGFESVGYDSWDTRRQTPENATAGVDTGIGADTYGLADMLGQDPAMVQTIQALMDRGLMTAGKAQSLLFGEGGGGGGGTTAYQSAQLARQAQQDEWNQILDYIGAAADERQLQAQMQTARRNALIQAAPDLAGGQEFRGGFGPYGGQTLLEMMRGGPGAPRSMRPVPLDLGPEPVDPELVNQLLGPLMGRG